MGQQARATHVENRLKGLENVAQCILDPAGRVMSLQGYGRDPALLHHCQLRPTSVPFSDHYSFWCPCLPLGSLHSNGKGYKTIRSLKLNLRIFALVSKKSAPCCLARWQCAKEVVCTLCKPSF